MFGNIEMLLGQNKYFLFLKQVSYKKSTAPFYLLAAPKIWVSYATVCHGDKMKGVGPFFDFHKIKMPANPEQIDKSLKLQVLVYQI